MSGDTARPGRGLVGGDPSSHSGPVGDDQAQPASAGKMWWRPRAGRSGGVADDVLVPRRLRRVARDPL